MGLRKHGQYGTRTYSCWAAMVRRCRDEKATGYANYGGRGLKVCPAWLDFATFFADMGEAPADCSLERENNDGNYEPGNVRWATRKEQANNRRSSAVISYDGREQTLQQWAEEYGVEPTLLRWRLRVAKWPMERALQPADARRRDTPISRYG